MPISSSTGSSIKKRTTTTTTTTTTSLSFKTTAVVVLFAITLVSALVLWKDERAIIINNSNSDATRTRIKKKKKKKKEESDHHVEQLLENSTRHNGYLIDQLGILQKENAKLQNELKQYKQQKQQQDEQEATAGSTVDTAADSSELLRGADDLNSRGDKVEAKQEEEAEQDDDLHLSNLEFLDLLPWEITSLEGIRNYKKDTTLTDVQQKQQLADSCKAPTNINPSCCLGSFSSGGEVSAENRNQGICNDSYDQLAVLKSKVQQFLRDNPPTTTRSTSAPIRLACDVCQIIELARHYKVGKIGFLGDSVHNQMFEALVCELQRRNYNVTTTKFIKYDNLEGFWRRKFLSTKVLEITSPTWANANDKVKLQLDVLYQVPVQKNSSLEIFQSIMDTTDVLILGFGLHYTHKPHPGFGNFEATFVHDMMDLLHSIQTNSQVKLLLHRETSATHFDSENGAWEPWVIEASKEEPAPNNNNNTTTTTVLVVDRCVPLEANHFPWREVAWNKAIRDEGQLTIVSATNLQPQPQPPQSPLLPTSSQQQSTTSQLREFITLPYYDLTSSLYDMHPFHSKAMDCAHYCSSPYLFMTIWRSIRLAMDRHYIHQQQP